MCTRALSVLLVAGAAGCGSGRAASCPDAGGFSAALMQYNVDGDVTLSSDPARGHRLADQIAATAPDFLTAEECNPCDALVAMLPARYRQARPARAAVSILYDSERWSPVRSGVIRLGENDDGWGERIAMWAVFDARGGPGCVTVYATHFCVPIRSTTDACDTSRQLEYADKILADASTRVGPVIIGGDFNVFDGFDTGPVVAHITAAGFLDSYRAAHPSETNDPITFQGNSWAPPGRIDYLFARSPAQVTAASIDQTTVPAGKGSDHYPTTARVSF